MANELTVSGQGPYGAMQPSGTIGAEEFAAHDPANSWQDQGEAEALANQFADDLLAMLAAHGADQVKKAVVDWFSNAHAAVDRVEDTQVVLVDASSDGAQFGSFYRVDMLYNGAVAQQLTNNDLDNFGLTLTTWSGIIKNSMQLAEQHGNNQALQLIQAHLADLNSSFRGPAPVAATPDPRQQRPGRPLRPGAVRGTPVRGPHAPTGTGRAPATTQQRRSPDPQIAGAEPHRPSRRSRALAAPAQET